MPSIRLNELIAPRSQNAVKGMAMTPSSNVVPNTRKLRTSTPQMMTTAYRDELTEHLVPTPQPGIVVGYPQQGYDRGCDGQSGQNHPAIDQPVVQRSRHRNVMASTTVDANRTATPPATGIGRVCHFPSTIRLVHQAPAESDGSYDGCEE